MGDESDGDAYAQTLASTEMPRPKGSAQASREEESSRPTSSQPGGTGGVLEPGRRVGRFVLSRKLGEGGMGVVFVARDPELRRDVAIKVLRPHASEEGATQAQQRMLREAQAMAMLGHPNLVTIYEVGTVGQDVFLAMEYVIGDTLEQWMSRPRHLEDVLETFDAAGRALQAVHDAGLVHRDFKPANVLVADDGTVKVLDLGIARMLSPPEEEGMVSTGTRPEGGSQSQNAFDSNLTQEGALVGTPAYMSPEQLMGQEVGPASDQFAFAVSLFEALAGRRPYQAKSPVQLLARIMAVNREAWPETSEAPEALRRVIERALSTAPNQRFDSMAELLESIRGAAGIRGQIRHLTQRWQSNEGAPEYLLSEGSLLSEGRLLLKERPEAFNQEQLRFVSASARLVERRRLVRRLLVAGLLALALGLVPALWLIERRGSELQAARRAEVSANIAALRERIFPVFASAEQDILLMFDQRASWMPYVVAMLEAESERSEPGEPGFGAEGLTAHVAQLNHYFRPVVERTPSISSLMVSRDDGVEYLLFEDRDAEELDQPYRWYNRLVHRPRFGDGAFQVFWSGPDGDVPRVGWLDVGGRDSRGQIWSPYRPTDRPFYRAAKNSQPGSVVWTHPYLFFVTKDAGITGAVAWNEDGHRWVLGVDFMLTDLSRVTMDLESDDYLAAVATERGRLVALPKDPRLSDMKAVRRFFRQGGEFLVAEGSTREADATVRLPGPSDLNVPELAAAIQHPDHDAVFGVEVDGRSLWAAKRPIGPERLGLEVVVVERMP